MADPSPPPAPARTPPAAAAPRAAAPPDVRVRVGWLPAADAEARFRAALFPRLDRRPTSGPLAERVAVVAAQAGGRTVGVALGHVRPDLGVGEVLSLAVAAGHRRRGLGRALLAGAERALAARAPTVQAAWRSDWRSAPAVERLLWASGWDPPREHRLLYTPTAAVYGRPWVEAPPPPGYALADWPSLSDGDRAGVERALDADPDARALSPFAQPERTSPTLSVWLRHGGRVVGWLRAVRLGPALAEYAGLYVAPGHRRRGPAQAVLAEALRRHRRENDREHGGATPRGVFAVAPQNAAMRALAGAWLGADGAVRATVWLAGKRLAAPSDS